ncbi:MAG: hypothetical protein KR126chlam1_01332 [Chlamydiae bacterium]|nr:hypothetical protein [Chlamydiota bacterium]
MNILPLVSAFILLFAIGSYTVIHQFRAAVQETLHFTDSMQIQRQIETQVHRNAFNKIPGKDPFPEETEKRTAETKKKVETEYTSPREAESIVQESKLNITSLFQEQGDPLLESATLNLLQSMYAFTDLYEPNLEVEILRLIRSTLKKDPSIDTFEKLLPRIHKEHRDLFYKLVKGTNNYKMGEFEGYPALGDFISITPKERTRPILFPYASFEVLKALFGTSLTHQIYLKEQEKWEKTGEKLSLTKTELEEFLLEHRINLADYQKMLLFGHQKKSGKEFQKTESSKIRLRVNHPISTPAESPEQTVPPVNNGVKKK